MHLRPGICRISMDVDSIKWRPSHPKTGHTWPKKIVKEVGVNSEKCLSARVNINIFLSKEPLKSPAPSTMGGFW